MNTTVSNSTRSAPFAALALLVLGVALFGCTASSQPPSGAPASSLGAWATPAGTATLDASSGYAGSTPAADTTNQTASDLQVGDVNGSDLQYVQ